MTPTSPIERTYLVNRLGYYCLPGEGLQITTTLLLVNTFCGFFFICCNHRSFPLFVVVWRDDDERLGYVFIDGTGTADAVIGTHRHVIAECAVFQLTGGAIARTTLHPLVRTVGCITGVAVIVITWVQVPSHHATGHQ